MMRRFAVQLFLVAATTAPAWAQSPQPTAQSSRTITLEEAIKLSERQGLAAEAARSARDVARWRDQAFSARLFPQVRLAGNAADLDRGINPITLPNGETQFIRQAQNQSSLGVSVA